MKEFFKSNWPYMTLGIIWLLSLASAIFQPSLNDPPVFWSWAQLVHDSPLDGWDAFFSVWEIKGLLSRCIYYQLYILTNLFVSDFYPYGHFVFTAIGLIEITFILACAVYIIPSNFLSKRGKYLLFFISTIAIYSSSAWANMQPDVWGTVLLFFSFAILLRNGKMHRIIAGILLGLLFFVKTPLLLLSGCAFFAYMLVFDKTLIDTIKDLWLYALSALTTVCLILVTLYFTYPVEIHDIFTLPQVYSNLFCLRPAEMLSACNNGVVSLLELPLHIPIVTLGLISLCVYLSTLKLKRNIVMLCVWIFPLLYIVISNAYFYYHYTNLIFPSILSIYLTYNQCEILHWKKVIFGIGILLILGTLCSSSVVYVLLTITHNFLVTIPYILMALAMVEKWRKYAFVIAILFSTFIFSSFTSGFSYFSRTAHNETVKMVVYNESKGYPIGMQIGNAPILHLTDGMSPIWIKNPSYLREFYPLQIFSSNFMNSQEGIQLEDKILNYDGDILIISDDYERRINNTAHLQEIKVFIDENYIPQDTIYQIYSLFELYKKHPIGHADLFIYQKRITK